MKRNKTRMVQWFLLAAIFYAAAILVPENPQLQTALWKCGHITLGSFIGYWVDRHLFGRLVVLSAPNGRLLARAIVVSAAVIGMAFGL